MTISDVSRARFEGIGLDVVRRELAVGNVRYLHGVERSLAAEWVAEQEGKLNAARRREKWKFIATLVVSIIAAVAAVIAALPVIKSWLW